MTWIICADLAAWVVEWVERRSEQWSEAHAKAQGDTGKGESPRIWVRGFLGWLM